MRSRSSLVGIAVLIALTGCRGVVEHGNVAFDVSPEGKRIVFSAADGDLYLFHLDTQQVDRLTSTEARDSCPAFSPQGRSIVFCTSGEGNQSSLAIFDLDSKRVRALTNGDGACDSSPAFSQDGKQVTFVRARLHRPYSMGGMTWDDWDIYVVKEDGSEPRRLTRRKYYGAGSPHFSGDGKSVIYSGVTNNYPAPSHSLLLEVATDGNHRPKILGPSRRSRGQAVRTDSAWELGSATPISRRMETPSRSFLIEPAAFLTTSL